MSTFYKARSVCLTLKRSLVVGRGVVVTGKLERGRLKKGDKVQLIGNRCNAKGQIAGAFVLLTFFGVTAIFL